MISDGGEIVVREKRGSPEVEDIVDDGLGEMGLAVQDACKLESCT
jgi:hypothetical protein